MTTKQAEQQDCMLRWFESRRLPLTLRMIADLFKKLANDLVSEVHAGPERWSASVGVGGWNMRAAASTSPVT